MRSWLRTAFTLAALLLVLALVGVAVAGVIRRHVEEHGHHRAGAVRGVEGAQRGEGGRAREGQQGGHGSFFAPGSVSDAVRRRRNVWDNHS